MTKRHHRPPVRAEERLGAARPPSARVAGRVTAWAPTSSRIALGLVLAWFGYHELVAPTLWTGYVPVLAASSTLAVLLVLAHGFVLLVLSAALVTGVAYRAAAALAAVLVAEIVVFLAVTGGLSDIVLRDLGVLGLALGLLGDTPQRLVLTR